MQNRPFTPVNEEITRQAFRARLTNKINWIEVSNIIDWACEHSDPDDQLLKEAVFIALKIDHNPSHEILINKTIQKLCENKKFTSAWGIYSYAVQQGWASVYTHSILIKQAGICQSLPSELLLEYAKSAYANAKRTGIINEYARNNMLVAIQKLAGFEAAGDFFEELKEEGVLTAATYSHMIWIYNFHGDFAKAESIYMEGINTSSFKQDPELHATMIKAATEVGESDLIRKVYEIAASVGAVHDKGGFILREYARACKTLEQTPLEVSESKYSAQDLRQVTASIMPERSSYKNDAASSVSQRSSVHSRSTPNQFQFTANNEFESQAAAYRVDAPHAGFTRHLDMVQKAGENHSSEMIRIAFYNGLAKDSSSGELLFNVAMQAASKCNDFKLTCEIYNKGNKLGIGSVGLHTCMVKIIGDMALNLASSVDKSQYVEYAIKAFEQGVETLANPMARQPKVSHPNNTLYNTAILTYGNLGECDEAHSLYLLMIESRKEQLRQAILTGEKIGLMDAITDVVTHSNMMAAATKGNPPRLDWSEEAYDMAIELNEAGDQRIHHKMMKIAAEVGDLRLLEKAHGNAKAAYSSPDQVQDTACIYAKMLAKAHAVLAERQAQHAPQNPNPIASKLHSSILASLKQRTQSRKTEAPAPINEQSSSLLLRKSPNELQAAHRLTVPQGRGGLVSLENAEYYFTPETKVPAPAAPREDFLKTMRQESSSSFAQWNTSLTVNVAASSSSDTLFSNTSRSITPPVSSVSSTTSSVPKHRGRTTYRPFE